MAISQFNLQHQTYCYRNFRPKMPPHFTINPKLRFQNSFKPPKIRYKCFYNLNSASKDDFLAPNIPKTEVKDKESGDIQIEVFENCKRWVLSVRSMLPGGIWWNLSDSDGEGSNAKAAKPVTVLLALRRIWALVAEDRWVVYAAFASLTIAVLSEISMPNLLAASVFSAQSGETAVFYRNSQLLLLLCFTSGISSGLRSGYFGMANMILLKRLRETLFKALIFQDISFFDTEAVGDLTSRLGADCQRLSNIIGVDLNLILRNVLQAIGALINLLTLSWPLALSTLVICFVLSTIFLVYGRTRGSLLSIAPKNICPFFFFKLDCFFQRSVGNFLVILGESCII